MATDTPSLVMESPYFPDHNLFPTIVIMKEVYEKALWLLLLMTFLLIISIVKEKMRHAIIWFPSHMMFSINTPKLV